MNHVCMSGIVCAKLRKIFLQQTVQLEMKYQANLSERDLLSFVNCKENILGLLEFLELKSQLDPSGRRNELGYLLKTQFAIFLCVYPHMAEPHRVSHIR